MPAAAQPEPSRSDAADTPEAAGIAFTPAQRRDLIAYRDLLSTWNGRMNLVGPSAMAQFWTRHVADSAQLLTLAPQACTWADLGSGAGLPGVVLAILLQGRAGARVHLVESVAKRCGFLSEAVRTLDLPAQVHHARAEALSPAPAVQVVTARAVAPLERLLGFASPTLRKGAIGLFPKGRQVEEELVEARRSWRFTSALHPSLTNPDGRIVEVTELSRA